MLGAGLPVGPLSPPRKTKARRTAGLFGTRLLRVRLGTWKKATPSCKPARRRPWAVEYESLSNVNDVAGTTHC